MNIFANLWNTRLLMNNDLEKIDALLRHIMNVQANTYLLGERLIRSGEFELGRALIANGLAHDNSKFGGIEWEHLQVNCENRQALNLAIGQHNKTNKHHPEAWAGGIKEMPRLFLAECICDWKARSSEFGSSLLDWIEGDGEYTAMKRYGFSKQDEVYTNIMYFVNLLLEPIFKAQ